MNHHHHKHGHHHAEEQSYGAEPYPVQNSGYYDEAAYLQPQVPAYGGYESAPRVPYAAVQTYGGGYGAPQPSPYAAGAMQTYPQGGRMQEISTLRADEHRHKTNEHRSEAVALGAAAFAAYEHHEEKVDPEHAERHRREERLAEATAVGAGGLALYEHEKTRHDHKQLEALGGDQVGNHHDKKHHNRHHHN